MQRHRSSRPGRRAPADTASPRSPSATDGFFHGQLGVHRGAWLVILGAGIAGAGWAVERLTRPRPDPPVPPVSARSAAVTASATQSVAPIVPVRPDERELAVDAETLAESLARDFAGNGRALAVSGRVLQLFVAPERGRARFEQATAIAADEPEAWLGLAETAWHDGDFPQAAAAMARLERVAPRLAIEKAFLWVDSLVKSGDGAAALELLGRIADTAGGEAALPGWAQVLLGQARTQVGDLAGAVTAYDRAAADPDQRVVAAYGLAQAWARLDDPERARQARENYAALQQENLAAFDRAQQAETTTGIDAKYPVLAGYHCEAGSLYARAGRFDEAAGHWRRAAALAPEWPEPRRFLEVLAAQEGR